MKSAVFGCARRLSRASTKKATSSRALSWANRGEEGRLFLVRGGWNDGFISECLKFTGRGKEHDNQVDAVSIAVQGLTGRSSKLHAF